MKKTLFTIFALAALMVSCTKENENAKFEKEEDIFTATLSDDISVKTSLNSTTKQVTWDLDDVIKINGKEFRALSSGTSSQFTGGESSTVSAPYYAFYPSTIAGDQNICVLPRTQTYSEGKATNLPMYAYSNSDKVLNFKNICGVLKIKAPAGNYLRTITVSSTNKALCGSFKVEEVEGNYVAKYRWLSIYDADTTVTLNITGDSVSEALIAIPANNTGGKYPETYSKLTITVTTVEGLTFSRTVDNLSIEVNHIKTISFIPSDAFYIEAVEAGKITFIREERAKKNTINLEYSADGINWQTFYNDTSSGSGDPEYHPITTEAGKRYYFRAPAGRDNPSFGNSDMMTWIRIVYKFVTSGKVKVGGNILYLLNNKGKATIQPLAFSHLFSQSSVTDASALILPSNQIADYCYQGMFDGDSLLTKAPNLPATTLSSGCYRYMFKDCTSLVYAPKLPATQLAELCYKDMFFGCRSLSSNADQYITLPATVLASLCYNCMFIDCWNVTHICMMGTSCETDSKPLEYWFNQPTEGLIPRHLLYNDSLKNFLKEGETSSDENVNNMCDQIKTYCPTQNYLWYYELAPTVG